jgi:DNA-binding CsgD family transcriptional regulator
VLVGRGAEISRFRRAVDKAASGRAAVVVIEGEPGVGKSVLLSAGAAQAASSAMIVLSAQCEELGRGRPFGPLLDAIHRAGLGTPHLVREMAERLGPTADRSSPLERGPELRSLLVHELTTRLEEQAAKEPVALCIDDLHWADGATLLTLGALVRRIADLPFLLAVTVRPGATAPDLIGLLHLLADGTALLRDDYDRIDLQPLSDEAVASLAKTLAGALPGPQLSTFLARCGGNPLLVSEAIVQLHEAELLRPRDGRIEATIDPNDPRLPATLGESVRSRMAHLEGESRAIATLAALLGVRFSVGDLSAVTKRSVTDLAPLIAELVRARVFVDAGDGFTFRHDLVRAAVIDALPVALRAELHFTIAQGLRAAGASLQVVAEHMALGATQGSTEAVAVLAEAAAQIVGQDPSSAESLLHRALQLCPVTAPEHDGLIAAMVDALAWSGRIVEAQSLARDVLTRPVRTEVEMQLRSALGRSLVLLGRPGEAIPHEERLITIQEELGRSPGWARAECAMCRLFGFDIDGALSDASQAIEIATLSDDPMTEIMALCVEVFARNALGETATAVELGTRATAIADDTASGEGHRLHPNLFRGVALLSAGERNAALAAFARGAQLGEELGASWALPVYHFTTALAHWDVGRWDDLLAEVHAGIAFSDEQQSSIGQVWALAVAGRVHLYRGDLEAAGAMLDRGDALVAQSGPQLGADWLALSRALLLEAQTRRREGTDVLRLVWETATELQSIASAVLVGADLTRLALESGDEDLAVRVVTALGGVARRHPHDRIVRARERRAYGLLRRDPEPLLEAVATLDALEFRFEAALARAEAGDLLAAAGRPDEAARILDRSLAGLDEIGAHLEADRVRSRLARLKPVRRRRPVRAVSGWEALTPTEREVAEEVCAGRSNPQVAARLGVSRRTVEAHLRSIYTKLDLATRLALVVSYHHHSERARGAATRGVRS